MMRIQYEDLISKIYRIIDEELEMETEEGSRTFRMLGDALFAVYMKSRPVATATDSARQNLPNL